MAAGPAAASPDDARERVERGDGHGHGSRFAAGPGREDGRRNRGADGEAGESEREWTVERMGRGGHWTSAFRFCYECGREREWSGWPWRGARRDSASVREKGKAFCVFYFLG